MHGALKKWVELVVLMAVNIIKHPVFECLAGGCNGKSVAKGLRRTGRANGSVDPDLSKRLRLRSGSGRSHASEIPRRHKPGT